MPGYESMERDNLTKRAIINTKDRYILHEQNFYHKLNFQFLVRGGRKNTSGVKRQKHD